MAAGTRSGGSDNLSLPTLITAALASAAAAVLVSQFSESGSAMAAALTAIFVPLLREAFHRPAQALSSARPIRRGGEPASRAAGAGSAAVPGGRAYESEARAPAAGTARLEGGAVADEGARMGLGAETGVLGSDRGAGAGDRSAPSEARTDFLGSRAGAPTDMLESDTRALGGDPAPADHGTGRPYGARDLEDETRPLEGGGPAPDDETRRLEGGGPAPDDETRQHGTAAGPPDSETRRLGGAPDLGHDETHLRPDPPIPAGGRSAPAGASGRIATPADARRPPVHRRRRVRIAILTGLLAFLVAAVALTVPELIAGGSIGGGDGRTTLFSGGGGSDTDSGSDDGTEDGSTGGESGGSDDSGQGGGTSDEPVPGGGTSDGEVDPGDGSGGGSEPLPDTEPETGGGAQQPPGDNERTPAPSEPQPGERSEGAGSTGSP